MCKFTVMEQIRARMIFDMPWFASLMLKMSIEEDNSIETAATDGKRIIYNRQFVEGLNAAEQNFLMAHEVLHVANMHMTRRKNRDPKKWNVACDYAINPLLVGSKGLSLPDGGLIDNEYEGMSAEQIYNMLPDQDSQGQSQGDGSDGDGESGSGSGSGKGSDPGKCGGVMDATNENGGKLTTAEAAELENNIKVDMRQATAAARACGKLPAGIAKMVEGLTNPVVDWRDMLREYVSKAARNEYQWSRPNRRFVHQGMYLPSISGEKLGKVVVAVDTSGSVSESEMAQFSSELNSILETYPCEVDVVYSDAKVQRVDSYTSEDYPVKMERVGYGGTSFDPVFEWFLDEGDSETAVIIYLTDMFAPPADTDPGVPVLWVSVGDFPDHYQPNFGTVTIMHGM